MNRKEKYMLAVTAMFCGDADAFAFPATPTAITRSFKMQKKLNNPWSLKMRVSGNSEEKTTANKRKRVDSLSASIVSSDEWSSDDSSFLFRDLSQATMETTVLPVLTTSLMITGNTVGAGMLVLPELAAGPGMGISTTIFAVAFLVNLISGLLIAEVAIHQHDTSGDDVPSSFKEFAQTNLPQWGGETSDLSANMISGISIMVNALVLAFNTAKVGDFSSEALLGSSLGVPANAISMAWIAACVVLVGTQSFTNLSTISSVLVFGLFTSFAGLLLPGLAHLTASPMELLLAPGTSSDMWGSACELAPIVLMSMVYQNIVPTVTKMLDYDRSKSIAAITLGSFLPFGMYVAWAFCVVGGGVDMGTGILDGPLLTLFTLTTIAGSSIGCVMSLAEEFDTFVVAPSLTSKSELFSTSPSDVSGSNDERFSVLSVLLSVACSGVALHFFGNDLNGALKVAGSFGSPLLYGVLPVAMAYTQRQKRAGSDKLPRPPPPALELPDASLGLLGMASTGFVGNELFQSAQEVLATVML